MGIINQGILYTRTGCQSQQSAYTEATGTTWQIRHGIQLPESYKTLFLQCRWKYYSQ